MEASKDDLKCFGEGFDRFPRTLPQDCVEYSIYIIGSNMKDVEVRNELRQVQAAGINLKKKLLKDFIWQREQFDLQLEREDGQSFLQGQTNYGDSVDDEWLIVYILRELSKQFRRIWIRVVDTDGQFLLIEAANVLPKWLNPEVADFRVWVNNGRLLIIPLQTRVEKNARLPPDLKPSTLTDAFAFLENQQSSLVHSTIIEAEAFYRLQGYPQKILNSLHHTLVTIPRTLAYILHENPAYISPAIEAFYLRDPIALRPLQKKTTNALIFSPDDQVTISVRFTKVGYAQLVSQIFNAPPSWAGVPSKKINSLSRKREEMGMKIACGFEMMISDPHNQDNKPTREMLLLLEDVKAGEAKLPTNAEVEEWSQREDDEGWLDINFGDFEKELAGKHAPRSAGQSAGFGDKGAQENLRKIVSRFEEFLNDNTAGVEGAEVLDDMDNDNDNDNDEEDEEISTSSEDGASDRDDKDANFDEDEFTEMMREMMGMPTGVMKEMMGKTKRAMTTRERKPISKGKVINEDTFTVDVSSDEEGEALAQSMLDMENELREAGALDLKEPQFGKSTPQKICINESLHHTHTLAANENDENAKEDIVDLNLAKNLLESFKTQAGMSGPGGNMMGLMGLNMPRDEHED